MARDRTFVALVPLSLLARCRLVAVVLVICSLAFAGSVPTLAQDATPAGGSSLLAELGYPELTITSDGTTTDLPAELEAGRYHIILENESELDVDIEFYQLPDGVTTDDLLAGFEAASRDGPVPDFFFDLVANGGPTSEAGGTGEVVLDLTPGEWVANLYTTDPETDEEVNTPETYTVTGEMPDIDEVPGAVEIAMAEMYFELPETIEAGPQIWKVVNNGLQPHHVILGGVPDGTTEEQVLELAASFGPPATPEAGATPVEPALSFEDVEDVFDTLVFSRGQANYYEIDVEPGTYAMICFVSDPTGKPHVMLGMVEVFTVA